MAYDVFCPTPRSLEGVLAREIKGLTGRKVHKGVAGVSFRGQLEDVYRVCLWSRTASRVLVELSRFPAADQEALYQGVHDIPWQEHFDVGNSFSVHFTSRRSALDHTHFAALKAKDAIVDRFREECGERPGVDTRAPDIRIQGHIENDEAVIYLDMAGAGLHQRSYRKFSVEAPVRENLAAALLYLMNWPELTREGYRFLDPMCGSGTLLIEAALMAGDVAPALLRKDWGFLHWKGHLPELWKVVIEEARQRRDQGRENMPEIRGFDIDEEAIAAAKENIRAAGMTGYISVEQGDIFDLPAIDGPGLIITNPPYGERLKPEQGLARLYGQIGQAIGRLPGWKVGVLTSEPGLIHRFRREPQEKYSLYNGALEVKLFTYEITAGDGAPKPLRTDFEAGLADPLINRVRKNMKHLRRWARKNDVHAVRIYDADIPEFALAIDQYDVGEMHYVVAEYAPSAKIDTVRSEQRLAAAMAALPEALEVTPEQVHLKQRSRKRGTDQYERLDQTGRFYVVDEDGLKLRVNFDDYLDTGLFLDHRITRGMLRDMASGKRFLNLFCYTGAATIHAAAGGAETTTSVDMSSTYLDWLAENLALNGFEEDDQHRIIRADCLQWLEDQHSGPYTQRYDLIFLDPPTFSNSKRMQQVLDINRDYPMLIQGAAELLSEDGVLVFSTNSRKFRMDKERLKGLKIEDISPATIPTDFERNRRIHYCWKISKD
jgi:23S rRNA (guanine2445-N2)-methyltransferase / 23S rRNA (guanine2069-N7)-methyltransferase